MNNFRALEKAVKKYDVHSFSVYVVDNDNCIHCYGDEINDKDLLKEWSNLHNSLLDNSELGLYGEYYGRAVALMNIENKKYILIFHSKNYNFLMDDKKLKEFSNILDNYKKRANGK